MLLIAPRISCFPPRLNLITGFQVLGDGLPTACFLSAVIAAGQPKRNKDKARASEANHGRKGIETALDLTRCSGEVQPKLQPARSIQKDFK